MAKIRSSFAFALLCVNLIVTISNVYFTVAARKYLNNNLLSSYNLRGTKERLLERKQNYFLEKEIETPKELRNLSPKAIRLSMLIINCLSFYFLLQLSISFGIDPDECCTICEQECCISCCVCCNICVCCCDDKHCNSNCDCNCNCDSNCNCNFSGSDCHCDNLGEGAIGLLVIFLALIAIAIAIFILIGLIYFLFYFGKHISRIIAIISLFVINATLVALSLYSGFDLNCILIASFSSFAAFCNFLGIFLPNLSCCEILTYDYAYDPYIPPPNPINQPDKQLIETPTQETPKKEETYYEKPYYEQKDAVPEQSSVELTNKPAAPDYIGQNQGIGSINGTSVSNDTPSEEYQQTNNNDNNQGNIPYPTPE